MKTLGVLIGILFVVALAIGVSMAAGNSNESAGIPSRSGDHYYVQNAGDRHEVSKQAYERSVGQIEAGFAALASWFYWANLIFVVRIRRSGHLEFLEQID